MKMLDTEFDEYSTCRADDLIRDNLFKKLEIVPSPLSSEETDLNYDLISLSVQSGILVPFIVPVERLTSDMIVCQLSF